MVMTPLSTTKRISATPGMNFNMVHNFKGAYPPGCITSSLLQRDSYANMQEFLSIQEIRTFEVVHVNDLMLILNNLTSNTLEQWPGRFPYRVV